MGKHLERKYLMTKAGHLVNDGLFNDVWCNDIEHLVQI